MQAWLHHSLFKHFAACQHNLPFVKGNTFFYEFTNKTYFDDHPSPTSFKSKKKPFSFSRDSTRRGIKLSSRNAD